MHSVWNILQIALPPHCALLHILVRQITDLMADLACTSSAKYSDVALLILDDMNKYWILFTFKVTIFYIVI